MSEPGSYAVGDTVTITTPDGAELVGIVHERAMRLDAPTTLRAYVVRADARSLEFLPAGEGIGRAADYKITGHTAKSPRTRKAR